MLYDNVRDAEMRLYGTIIRLDGKPMYVKSVEQMGQGIVIHYCSCFDKSQRTKSEPLDHPKWDVSSPPLGYYELTHDNGMIQALYATRMPARRQKQGLDVQRVHYYTNGTGMELVGVNPRLHALGNCIVGSYGGAESYEEMMESGLNGWSVAFSREFAADKRHVYYRAHKIGDIIHSDEDERLIHTISLTHPQFHMSNITEVFRHDDDWRIN